MHNMARTCKGTEYLDMKSSLDLAEVSFTLAIHKIPYNKEWRKASSRLRDHFVKKRLTAASQ